MAKIKHVLHEQLEFYDYAWGVLYKGQAQVCYTQRQTFFFHHNNVKNDSISHFSGTCGFLTVVGVVKSLDFLLYYIPFVGTRGQRDSQSKPQSTVFFFFLVSTWFLQCTFCPSQLLFMVTLKLFFFLVMVGSETFVHHHCVVGKKKTKTLYVL